MATQKKYFCPRLVDYIVLVGARRPNSNNDVAQTPELLRRYPQEDHEDFPLPPDVIYFCQPEGCLTVGQKRLSLRENTSFVFTLTDKDSSRMRYGICVNFYRPFKVCERKTSTRDKILANQRQNSSSNDTLNVPGEDGLQSPDKKSPRTRRKLKQAKRIRNNSLTSLCILSHHPFISTFRECLFILKKLIDSCNERTSSRKVGGSKASLRDSVWGVLTGICTDIPPLVRHDVRQIETWMLRFLSAPVPVPGKTRVELEIVEGKPPMIFALPDHTRFSLADFPLHLPLELLGVETCLKVMTLIMLEHKVVLQSRDYNALSMSVMAFVAMIYPLEYMFPVIPLLPTCMGSAEQLLLAPTPFIIGVPASFFLYKKGFKLPDDVWLVDLDTNKIRSTGRNEVMPFLPEPEGTTLKTHLKQALASMSLSPPPIKDFEQASREVEAINRRHESQMNNDMSFNPFIFGNDVDSVDVATRAAMVRYFNSPNVLAHITEHTRTLRLHPRPVVAFQAQSFLSSRTVRSSFTERLARTQAVEYFGEFCLNPTNVTFLRIHTGMYDPQLIGDKGKWYSEQLQPIQFKVFFDNCTLGTALENAKDIGSDSSNPTDESGEESDGGGSSSSSYSSLNDFVTDMMNSEIHGDVPEDQEDPVSPVSEMDTNIYNPPDTLQIPAEVCQSDSAYSFPESDSSSSQEASTSPDVKTTTSGGDTDGDAESLQYDSDTPSDKVSSMRAKMAAQLPKFSKSFDDSASRAREERKKEKNRDQGRSSPTFLDKVNALFRSDSSDSSAPPSPTKTTSSTKKPSLLKGIMDLALESTGTIATNLKEPSSPTSVRSTDNSGYAPSVQSDPGLYRSSSGVSSMGMPARRKKNSSPFPKDTRRSLVERSSLIRHHSTTKPNDKDKRKQSMTDERPNRYIEDQQFLKEITRGVMEGNNVGWLNWSRLKKLMQNENLRAQVISQLMPQESTVTEDYIEDTQVSKAVYKGLVSVLKAVIAGLEHSYEFHTAGGMASAFAVLELAHTHYFGKEPDKGWGKRDSISVSSSSTSTEEGGMRVHSPRLEDNRNDSSYEMIDDAEVPIGMTTGAGVHGAVGIAAGLAVTGVIGDQLDMTPLTGKALKSRSLSLDNEHNNDEYIKDSVNNNVLETIDDGITFIARTEIDVKLQSSPSPQTSTPTRPNEIIQRRERFSEKISSMDSELSEASTLVSFNSSDTLGNDSDGSTGPEGRLRRTRITHHSIRSVMSDSEVELNGITIQPGHRRRAPNRWSTKSCMSAGFRYHNGNMIATDTDTAELMLRHYVFEALIAKDRSPLWDQLQFWEDSYLDAVAAERDAVGMDQGPAEMIKRYESLGPTERKRLEEDEDKLLSDMLYNMTAYMVMIKVPKPDIKRKIRRLLGRSHIGLLQSQNVTDLLDQINNLHGNDIDLKPSSSRQMRKHSFVVHAGSNTRGDVLFMEVCDDCVIIRSGNGAVCDRCWYERLVNMTYCPKTKVLCLWRRVNNSTKLDKFYTKKCRELYFCIKESMEKAATRQKNGITGEPELGGEFPIQDLKSGQGGLLQVTMEGVGLKFSQTKAFIELKDIKEYKTKKDVFMLVEFDQNSKMMVRHKFRSSMAHDIGYAMLCVFSYVAAARSAESMSRKELELRMAGRRREFLQTP